MQGPENAAAGSSRPQPLGDEGADRRTHCASSTWGPSWGDIVCVGFHCGWAAQGLRWSVALSPMRGSLRHLTGQPHCPIGLALRDLSRLVVDALPSPPIPSPLGVCAFFH